MHLHLLACGRGHADLAAAADAWRAQEPLPPEVAVAVVRGCGDCHTEGGALPWYAVGPVGDAIVQHKTAARERLNLAHWQRLEPPQRQATLFAMVNQSRNGHMPPRSYLWLHPAGGLDHAARNALAAYAVGRTPPLRHLDVAGAAADAQRATFRAALDAGLQPPVTATGAAFEVGYSRWQVVSLTDRFDNGTFRAILANPVAVNAMAHNQRRPWPDGAALAKVAWEKVVDPQGQTRAGAFKQVEFMVKASQAQASTQGWRYSRFVGERLTPWGKDAAYVAACTGCHAPVHARDYVYTEPRTEPHGGVGADLLALEGAADGTSLTARLRGGAAGAELRYPLQPSEHWFGARVPAIERPTDVTPNAGVTSAAAGSVRLPPPWMPDFPAVAPADLGSAGPVRSR